MGTMPESVPNTPATTEPGPSSRGVKAVLKKVRQPRSTSPLIGDLLREVKSKRPKANVKLIEKAYQLASAAHEGQYRRSGDPFISHPLAVATILAELGMDETTVAAALLHDSVEDTDLSLTEVEK